LLATADLTSLLPAITVRVLVICGKHDPSTPPERGAELANAIPVADLVTLGAAHISAIEAADDFSAVAKKFFDEVTTTPNNVAGRQFG
jgi:pimeloyl-ACP methyl ester carboxylesterase